MLFNKKNIATLTDKELVYQYQRTRNTKYFGALFNRYSHLVYGVCLKYLKNIEDAEDAMMQIFEKGIKDLQKITIEHPRAWLYQVAKNHCLMIFRKKRINFSENENLESYSENDDAINEKIKIESDLNAIEKGLNLLKEDQKIALILFYLEEKSYKEISEQTKWNIKKVKSEIQNGKRKLKIIINEQNNL